MNPLAPVLVFLLGFVAGVAAFYWLLSWYVSDIEVNKLMLCHDRECHNLHVLYRRSDAVSHVTIQASRASRDADSRWEGAEGAVTKASAKLCAELRSMQSDTAATGTAAAAAEKTP